VYTILIAISSVASSFSLIFLNTTEYYQFIVKIFALSEYLILSYFFYLVINRRSNYWFFLISTFFFLFTIKNCWLTTNSVNITYPLFYEFIFFILIILSFFFKSIIRIDVEPIYNQIEFWISTSLLIYFSGNFFFLIFVSISNVEIPSIYMQTVYSSITIIKNIILSVTFLLFGKNNEPQLQIDDTNNFNTLTANNT